MASETRTVRKASTVEPTGERLLASRRPFSAIRFLMQTLAVAERDFRSEFRTRYALNAVLLFAVTAITVIAMSVEAKGLQPEAQAALLWTIVFFAAMSGLHRTFVREEETRTADALRLSAPSSAVFLGKWVFNLGLLVALETIITLLFIVFMHVEIPRPELYVSVFLLGDVGLVTVCTLMAALVARARTFGALYAVICFPPLVPLLNAAVYATAISLGFQSMSGPMPSIRLLISFSGVMLTASLMLFDSVWRST